MKTYLSAVILAGMSLSFIACDQDVQTMPEPEIRAIKMEEEGYKRELTYEKGKLVTVKSTSVMPDKTFIETIQSLEFDESGRLVRTIIDGAWRMEYTYSGDRIVRTDEYRNSQPHQVHMFTYNKSGRMVEMLTVREDGEGVTPVSKVSHVYDLEGNVMESANYSYENNAFQLTSTFSYSGYDSMQSGDHHFGIHAINPQLKLQENNPGKMIVRNFNGLVTTTEEYTYQYNIQNFPVIRYTTVTFPFNGNSGIYKSEFFYEIK